MKIRLATKNDISRLCELLDELFSLEKEFISNKKLQEKALIKILEDETIGNIIVSINEEEKIVAMVNLLYTISTALGERVAILEDMIVSKNFQNKNIGFKLLEFAKKFAKDKGCKRITLLTDNDNLKAHKFYEKSNFQKSNMILFRIFI
jgi:GNAT superfamily N-acetyltransferase